jgi:hypothetical protein
VVTHQSIAHQGTPVSETSLVVRRLTNSPFKNLILNQSFGLARLSQIPVKTRTKGHFRLPTTSSQKAPPLDCGSLLPLSPSSLLLSYRSPTTPLLPATSDQD